MITQSNCGALEHPLSENGAVTTPCLLAFDTSTEQLAMAVVSPQGVWVHRSPGGASVSSTLLPQAQLLLQQAGLKLSGLNAVAFGVGPGAFTGLRASCAVAQGLAFGLGCRILQIDSLLIVAEDARWQASQGVSPGWFESGSGQHCLGAQPGPMRAFEIGVAMDARMHETYAGRYWHDGQRWQVAQAPALYSLPALEEAWAQPGGDDIPAAGETPNHAPPRSWLAGSALLAFGDRLVLPRSLQRLPLEHDRAAALARLALQAWIHDALIDTADALPLYLRDKVALTTLERQAVRAAGSL